MLQGSDFTALLGEHFALRPFVLVGKGNPNMVFQWNCVSGCLFHGAQIMLNLFICLEVWVNGLPLPLASREPGHEGNSLSVWFLGSGGCNIHSIHINMLMETYTDIYVCIHAHMYTHTYMYMHICIYV